MLIYTPLVFLCISHIAFARRNVSLDDSDDSIVYHGNWLPTPYDRTNRGGYHKVTADNNAYATLAFNGVAIYFYSPLWPFGVTTALSLDGGERVLVDLRDYDVPYHADGAETVRSEIIWYTDGLSNTSHLLNVSVGDGEDLAILDYLVYTIVEPGDPMIAPIPAPYTHTRSLSLSSSSSSPTSSQASTTSRSSTKIGLSVTLGLVCVIFSSIVFWAAFWWWKRRNRRRLDESSRTSSFDHSNMSEVATGRPIFPRTTGIPSPSTGKNLSLGLRTKPSRRAGPSSSRRSSGSSSRAAFLGKPRANKTLSTIPETSGDHLNEEEDSASQGSSGTSTTSTTTATSSPETSLKNDKPGDPRNDSPPQDDSPTVRLVTDS